VLPSRLRRCLARLTEGGVTTKFTVSGLQFDRGLAVGHGRPPKNRGWAGIITGQTDRGGAPHVLEMPCFLFGASGGWRCVFARRRSTALMRDVPCRRRCHSWHALSGALSYEGLHWEGAKLPMSGT
jgi:hypothetical protein